MIEEGFVLFPFRTLAMISAFVAIFVVSELTKQKCKPSPLIMPHERKQESQKAS
jgi:high affinity choline transporter 7